MLVVALGVALIAWGLWTFRHTGELESTFPRTSFYRRLRVAVATMSVVFGVVCIASSVV